MKLSFTNFVAVALMALAALALSAGVYALHAQMIRFRHDAPNCNAFAPHFDNPFSDTKGYTQPSLAWDAEYAAGSMLTAYALHRWLHVPHVVAALVPSIGFGLGFHARGYARGLYPVSEHWAQVLWDRSAPALWATQYFDRDTSHASRLKDKVIAAETWAIIEAPLTCFDR